MSIIVHVCPNCHTKQNGIICPNPKCWPAYQGGTHGDGIPDEKPEYQLTVIAADQDENDDTAKEGV